jgi:leader peptidase (prepilin peptidase)/N-methyltransferase
MTVAVIVGCLLLGLAVGSFVNVVIWRVPRGESVVRPASHCPQCRSAIRVRDNVPVLSWLALGGRCARCRLPISPRYPLVELLTGALFVALGLRLGARPQLLAFLYLAAVAVALAAIDIEVQRLPDRLTLPSYLVGLVLLSVSAGLDGQPGALLRALIGMAALFAGYAILVLVYPSGMGLGDVKLAGVLGLYLGWLGWGSFAVGVFAAFLLGGLVGLAMLLGGAGRKARLPFGPYMVTGAMIGILAGQPLWSAYLHALG